MGLCLSVGIPKCILENMDNILNNTDMTWKNDKY